MTDGSIVQSLDGGDFNALRSGRGGVHGFQEDLDRDLQVGRDGVGLCVVGLQNAFASLVVLA